MSNPKGNPPKQSVTESSSDALAAVSLVSPKAQLTDLRLDGGSFDRVKPSQDFVDQLPQVTQEIIQVAERLEVMNAFTLSAALSGETDTHGPASAALSTAVVISARFVAVYTLRDSASMSAEQIDVFGRVNSIYNCWPYWREFVQASTVRMGLPSLVLPLLTVGGALRMAGFAKSAKTDNKSS
jgi:hypothetical protein